MFLEFTPGLISGSDNFAGHFTLMMFGSAAPRARLDMNKLIYVLPCNLTERSIIFCTPFMP